MIRKLSIAICALVMLQASLYSLFANQAPVVYANTISTLYETSFENSNDLDWLMSASSYDTSQMHSGTQSLKYVTPQGPNNPGEQGAERSGPSVRFPVNPGDAYDVSVWVKTTQLSGLWAGAMVRISMLDSSGNVLVQKNNNPFNSEDKWQKVKLPTVIASQSAAEVEITLFAYGGQGTIWFDDLLIAETAPPLDAIKIAYESSFEDSNDAAWLMAASSYDTGEKYTGAKSLKYVTPQGPNTPGQPGAEREGPSIRIPAKPGYAYDVSVWIKTTQLVGDWSGAMVRISFLDSNNQVIEQKNNNPLNTLGNWQNLQLPSLTAAENAAEVQITLFGYGGQGTMWFDHLVVTESVPPQTRTIYSTSFEDTQDSAWLMSATTYDTSEKYTGLRSLKYVTPQGPNNPGQEGAERAGPSIRLPAKPGYAYDVSAWIKTSQLSGLWAGAMVRISFLDGNANVIEQKNNNPLNTLNNWQHLKLPTLIANENAAEIEITIFAYGGQGTMWFDDLVVTESRPPLFTSKLDTPNYRGYLIPGGNSQVKVVTRGATGIPAASYTTVAQLVNASNQVVAEQVFSGQLNIQAVLDTANLPAGKYTAVIAAKRTGEGSYRYSEKWPITKVNTALELPESYIDDFGRFWKDGELFFPIGIYTDHTSQSDLDDLQGSAINTIMPYGYPNSAELDLAHDYGMNVIFSLKDFFYNFPFTPSFIQSEEDEVHFIKQHVQDYKDHPALLAWYLSDETLTDNRLRAHYQAVLESDPNHPAYVVDFRKPDPFTIHHTTDIFGFDLYPVYGKTTDDLSAVGSMQKEITADLLKKGQWAVVQAHNLGNYEPEWGAVRPPTKQEMQNMSWQYITEGAKGILFYSLFDLKQDASGKTYGELLDNVKAVAQELKNMSPVILSEAQAPQVSYPAQNWLHVMTKNYNGNTYVIAVNNSTQSRQAAFTAPDISGSPIHVWNEGRSLSWSGNQFSDTFAPLSVHIYEIGTGNPIPIP
ncbi:hypothetical protein [Paenibacillus sp. IITD108]|uniref:hypothetical protein n=1 Tax=Paenibacillus sp. IITD108 TaxID=3116649 RepID=UPI002F3F776C